MLVKLIVPADIPESRALRLLELCATQLWGADGSPYLERWEVPTASAAAPFSPKGPETSRRSAMIHAPQAGSESREILALLNVKGPMTAAALTGLLRLGGEFPNIGRNQVAARLWALRGGGWVEHVHVDDLRGSGPAEWMADHDGFVVEKTSATGRHYGRVHKLSVKGIRLFTTQEARP